MLQLAYIFEKVIHLYRGKLNPQTYIAQKHTLRHEPASQPVTYEYVLPQSKHPQLILRLIYYCQHSPENVWMREAVHELNLTQHLLACLLTLVHFENHHLITDLVLHLYHTENTRHNYYHRSTVCMFSSHK